MTRVPMRVGVYPRRQADGRLAAMDEKGAVLGYGVEKPRRIRFCVRGVWISSELCSYRFALYGVCYVGRGRGDGVYVNLRRTDRPVCTTTGAGWR